MLSATVVAQGAQLQGVINGRSGAADLKQSGEYGGFNSRQDWIAIVLGEKRQIVMIFAVLELVPQIQKRQAMLEVLRFVEERVRSKSECLECGVLEAANSPRVFYMEQWRSAKDLHVHIQSGLYSKILHAMELACEEPRISFHEVSQTESMELIRQLRS